MSRSARRRLCSVPPPYQPPTDGPCPRRQDNLVVQQAAAAFQMSPRFLVETALCSFMKDTTVLESFDRIALVEANLAYTAKLNALAEQGERVKRERGLQIDTSLIETAKKVSDKVLAFSMNVMKQRKEVLELRDKKSADLKELERQSVIGIAGLEIDIGREHETPIKKVKAVIEQYDKATTKLDNLVQTVVELIIDLNDRTAKGQMRNAFDEAFSKCGPDELDPKIAGAVKLLLNTPTDDAVAQAQSPAQLGAAAAEVAATEDDDKENDDGGPPPSLKRLATPPAQERAPKRVATC